MPVKTFKFHDESNIDKTINDWADQNKYKIDNISVCPIKWYLFSFPSNLLYSIH
jgi:hypothetical protein